ncbi:MAG: hypothetical protein ABR921_06880 [Candidatus Sulfotelmatobacter sp.]
MSLNPCKSPDCPPERDRPVSGSNAVPCGGLFLPVAFRRRGVAAPTAFLELLPPFVFLEASFLEISFLEISFLEISFAVSFFGVSFLGACREAVTFLLAVRLEFVAFLFLPFLLAAIPAV